MGKKMQTLSSSVQSKNGHLYAVIWYHPKNSSKQKPVWRSLGLEDGTRQAIVNKRLREVTNDFEEKLNEELSREETNEGQRVYDYMASWLEKHRTDFQINTLKGYTTLVEGKIKRYFIEHSNITISTIDVDDIEDFYEYLHRTGAKSNTVIHYHALMHKAFKQAVKSKVITVNPFDNIERPKREEFHGQSYSEQELQSLLNLAIDDPIFPAIVLAGCMGLRRSEALGARWSRIDWEKGTILIDTKIVEVSTPGIPKKAIPVEVMKNKSSKRTLTLPRQVLDMLLVYRARKEKYKQLFKGSYNREYEDYVCVDELGRMLMPSYITNHFVVLQNKLGLKRIRYHDLRHTFASLLLKNQKPLIDVSNFLGHSDISTTANIYAHLDISTKQGCADLISSILDRKESAVGIS